MSQRGPLSLPSLWAKFCNHKQVFSRLKFRAEKQAAMEALNDLLGHVESAQHWQCRGDPLRVGKVGRRQLYVSDHTSANTLEISQYIHWETGRVNTTFMLLFLNTLLKTVHRDDFFCSLLSAAVSQQKPCHSFTAVSHQSLPGAAPLPGLCVAPIYQSKADLEAPGAGDALHHASGCQHGLRVAFGTRLSD